MRSARTVPVATSTARAWLPAAIILAGVAAYWTSFQGVFVFDDVNLIDDPRMRLSNLGALLRMRRPVANLTLAINHAVGAVDPWGYHLVNLTIHLLAGLTLYGVVRRALRLNRFDGRFARSADGIAAAIASIWVLHPLQTQSVTYTIQRAESLMGLFYLLTIYCVLRGAAARAGIRWYVGAIAACALGMGSKAVMVTAPLVVLLCDWVLIAPSWKVLMRRRWWLYVGLAATIMVLGFTNVLSGVLDPSKTNATVGFGVQSVTPIEYLCTQAGVILHYLRLAFWPAHLCLDYQWPIARGAANIVPQGIIILVLLAWTAWGIYHRSPMGFVGAWFFLILAPTSSIVPIKDLAFEHRMYLPLAAVVTFVVATGWTLLRRLLRGARAGSAVGVLLPAALVVAIAAPLAYATFERNKDYHSRLRMWRDVLATRPDNPRAHSEYGRAWDEEEGNLHEAIKEYRVALSLQPDYPLSHYNLGNALKSAGRHEEAVDEYHRALEQRPHYPQAVIMLGTTLMDLRRYDDAAEAFEKACKQDPTSTKPVYNLGNAYLKSKRYALAEVQFRRAVQMDPGYLKARNNLGLALVKQERFDEAADAYRQVIRRNPKYAQAIVNLGIVFEKQERWSEAVEQFRRATQVRPNYDLAHYRLGKALAAMGRHSEAITAFEETLRLDPKDAQARRRLKASRQALKGSH